MVWRHSGGRGASAGDGVGGDVGMLAGEAGEEHQAGVALTEGQERGAVVAEVHQVTLPVAKGGPVGGGGRALAERDPVDDVGGGAAALAPPEAALGLGPGQAASPGVVLGAGKLGVDKAVDALMGDHSPPRLAGQAFDNLLGGPPQPKAPEVRATPGPAPAGRRATGGTRRRPARTRQRSPRPGDGCASVPVQTVDDARSKAAAICRSEAPWACRSAILCRSSMLSCVYAMATPYTGVALRL